MKLMIEFKGPDVVVSASDNEDFDLLGAMGLLFAAGVNTLQAICDEDPALLRLGREAVMAVLDQAIRTRSLNNPNPDPTTPPEVSAFIQALGRDYNVH